MNVFRRTTATLALALTTALVVPAAAQASGSGFGAAGATSLASVLTADGNQFDRDWYDYDIVSEEFWRVRMQRSVRLLADGSVPLTAFIPNDRAFQVLVKDLTGQWVRTESEVFAAVASLGIDTVEDVLLYHVVPGATITYKQALAADGAALTTAQGGTITVRVVYRAFVKLVDADPDDANPFVVRANINRGNVQIAHGISQVLRPLDL